MHDGLGVQQRGDHDSAATAACDDDGRSPVRYRLPAEIDLAAVPQLRRDLAAAIEASDAELVIDATALTFIDSSGIAALLEALATLQSLGRRLCVSNLGARPRATFETLGLTDLLVEQGAHSKCGSAP